MISNIFNKNSLFLMFFLSATITALILTYSMSIFYIHIFFSYLVLLFFLFGILLGNISVSLFHFSKFMFTGTLLVTSCVLLIMFLFPLTHIDYPFYQIMRVFLLSCFFFFGLLLSILLYSIRIYQSLSINLFQLIMISISIVIIALLQFYIKVPFAGVLFCIFCFLLALIFLSERIGVTLGFISLLIIFIVTFSFLQKFHYFHIKTPRENTAEIFELGSQIDIKTPERMTNQLLDLNSHYSDILPSNKQIYINGVYYGQFIGDLSNTHFAESTPYKILYSLKTNPKILILNSAGGGDVYLAHMLAKGEVDALERNQNILNRIRDEESLYVGGIYHNRNTLFYRSAVSPYISSTDKMYDILTLNFHLRKDHQLFFMTGFGYYISINSIRSYLNILNPQGVIFININTFNKEFNNAIALKIISTFKQASKSTSESFKDFISVFQTDNSLNLMLHKTPLSPEQKEQYIVELEQSGYKNIMDNIENPLYQNVQALINENQNQLAQIEYDSAPITNTWNKWYFQVADNLNIWPNSSWDSSFQFMKWFMLSIFITVSVIAIYARFLFTQTNLFKMGLGSFFTYFLSLGLVFGLGIIFEIDYFNYLLSSELISGGWALAVVLFGILLGEIFFKIIKRIYSKIYIGLTLHFVVSILLVIFMGFLQDYFLSLPLILKVLLPMSVTIFLFTFIFTPVIGGFIWVEYMQSKDNTLLRVAIILGVIMGFSIGFYIDYLFSAFWVLLPSIFFIVLSYILFLFLDKRSQYIDYIYSQEKI